ncbi:zinc-binding alcohol dehydrogenase family protein [Metabacillus sp. GX 13764]|uniref:zinc-binding alcohol dehydrogenase family protein n=1 Tax=Metabacillus kandeliae TaxID=2900151 RepID=UPI001E393464|nr:zinc-binding alcohol dehydrogenase family protein [Metabacillus kandeliae]MCD7035492.1 zinc-binding alcohol dehydrogenase family protein [Metabacillus kandeliae]
MGKMKAVGLYKHLSVEHPESLLDLEIDKPEATGRDLLIEVKAISVNPVDTKIRKSKGEEEEEPKILGWDAAGVVVETGPEVTFFKQGDEVYYSGSVARQGTNSEFHLVDERIAARKPESLGFKEAAAIPLTGITAWEALFERLGYKAEKGGNKGVRMLIIGAAGGVGSIAVQLASWAGFTVIGTASRPETERWAREMGADYLINHRESLSEQLKELDISEVDAIFCLNSTAEHWEEMVQSIKPQGSICSIVETDQKIDLSMLQQKSGKFVWEFMFTRSLFETDDMIKQREILSNLAQMLDEGTIRGTATETLSPINAEKLKEAHRKLESGKTIGKITLESFE